MGKCGNVPIRAIICAMIFCTTYINYLTRANQSLSITAMVTRPRKHIIPECIRDTDTKGNQTEEPANLADYGERYEWDESVQGNILASYFYGYFVGCIPAGVVAEWVGPFWTIFIATLCSGIFNSLSVPAATIHYGALLVCRFIIGFMGGLVYPALHSLIARWAPPNERGKFVGCLMGNTVGTTITWYVVAETTQSVNWYWGYHVLTIQIAIFLVVFWFCCADNPESHKWVTPEELEYIKVAQAGTVTRTKKVPPYLKMITSLPFWALVVAQYGNLWGLYLQLTAMPKFMHEVIGFKLRDSGIVSAFPQISRLVSGLFFGWLADYLVKNGKLTKAWVRKGFIVFSHIIPGITLLLVFVTKCNTAAAVIWVTISLGFNGACVATHLQNSQDLAPNFAGSMWGVVLLIGGTTGFICPNITGLLIKKNSGIQEWALVFVIGGLMYAGCGIVFMIFGSTQTQPWNVKKERQSTS